MDHVLINAYMGYVVCVSTDVDQLNDWATHFRLKRGENYEVRPMTRNDLGDHLYLEAREQRWRDMQLIRVRNQRIHAEREAAAQRKLKQALAIGEEI